MGGDGNDRDNGTLARRGGVCQQYQTTLKNIGMSACWAGLRSLRLLLVAAVVRSRQRTVNLRALYRLENNIAKNMKRSTAASLGISSP